MADEKNTDSPDESDDVAPAELSDDREIVDPEDTADDEYVDNPDTPDVNEAKLARATDEVRDLDEDVDGAPTRTRRRATARPTRRTASEDDAKPAGLATLDMTNLEPDEEPPRVGPITFVKQSVGELKEVRWPSFNEVQQYFIVVLVFVLFIVGFVSLLDFLFGMGILNLFA